MPSGRNTGLQVIHYSSLRVAGTTPFLASGILLTDMPLGAVITDADITVVGGFGVGAVLSISRTPGGPAICQWSVPNAARLKLTNASNALSAAESVIGGPLYLSVSPASLTGLLIATISFAPSLG